MLEPRGELRSRLLVADDDVLEAAFGFSRLVGVEDTTEVSGDCRTHGYFRHVRHGARDRVELASLPRHASHDGLTGGPEPGVIVTDNEIHAVHPAFLQEGVYSVGPEGEAINARVGRSSHSL